MGISEVRSPYSSSSKRSGPKMPLSPGAKSNPGNADYQNPIPSGVKPDPVGKVGVTRVTEAAKR